MAKSCVVFYGRHASVSRLLSGFNILGRSGALDVSFIENINNFRNVPEGSMQIVEAEIDGKIIAFDLGDRWVLCDQSGKDYLNRVDAYFARDYSNKTDIVTPEIFVDNKKVQPFGFNYYSTFPGNPIDRPSSPLRRISKKIKDFSGYLQCTYPEYFEGRADWKENGITIIFMARLWDDSAIKLDKNLPRDVYAYREYMIEERQRINADRIEIMRRLKREYGNAFQGGMFQDSFSENRCPDLVVPKSFVKKKNYIDKMKNSDICIGTMGLHRSIGWKTGEYVAAARAIVAERFEYVVPGGFDDGKHYIPYDTMDECLNAVDKLYSNPALLYEMKKANEKYYLEYLKPDRQILNAFLQAGISV